MTESNALIHGRPLAGASPIPLYVQLADVFRQRIVRGQWTQGEMIPTINQLEQEFGVSRVTVRQAIQLLSKEALLTSQRGKGTIVTNVPAAQQQLRVETTLTDLFAMYRGDKPVLTNIAESNARPTLHEGEGNAAPGYFHMRRVHARDGVKYCVISIYIEDSIFQLAPEKFRNEAVLPVLESLPSVQIGRARQKMHITKASAEVAQLLEVPPGEPMADVRRIFWSPDGTIIYLAEVSYRGDYIHLDIDLKP
ncbi:MAG: GntR family transcriptional regulator [Burkholderiaceae bacterium]